MFVFFLDFVADIFETLTITPKADLKSIPEELKQEVPEALHTMFAEKESREKAVSRHRQKKEKVTAICTPPTCSGMSSNVKTKTTARQKKTSLACTVSLIIII